MVDAISWYLGARLDGLESGDDLLYGGPVLPLIAPACSNHPIVMPDDYRSQNSTQRAQSTYCREPK